MTHPGWLRQRFQELRYHTAFKILRRITGKYISTKTPVFLPRIIKAPEKRSALSISPHPDDDILAVGGTLHGHILSGGTVTSLVLTSGERGTADTGKSDELKQIRRAETQKAANILGFTDLQFRDEPDGELKSGPELVENMTRLIRFLSPDVIYIPFPIDYHHDHLAATRMVLEALRPVRTKPVIRCYECIIPLIPNYISDITSLIEKKRQAVSCFQSQNQVSDYIYTIVEGLNRLRTHGLMGGKGYAEGIFQTSAEFLESLFSILDSEQNER
ncbi:PIG-L family deacetylase [bacterium]|nr:PIG-L family deacetylase [candidate division CSSED10-310 bacterium]